MCTPTSKGRLVHHTRLHTTVLIERNAGHTSGGFRSLCLQYTNLAPVAVTLKGHTRYGYVYLVPWCRGAVVPCEKKNGFKFRLSGLFEVGTVNLISTTATNCKAPAGHSSTSRVRKQKWTT